MGGLECCVLTGWRVAMYARLVMALNSFCLFSCPVEMVPRFFGFYACFVSDGGMDADFSGYDESMNWGVVWILCPWIRMRQLGFHYSVEGLF